LSFCGLHGFRGYLIGTLDFHVIEGLVRAVEYGWLASESFKAAADDVTVKRICPSSYNVEHQSGLSFGGSGSFA